MYTTLKQLDTILLDLFPEFNCGCEVEYVVTFPDGRLIETIEGRGVYQLFEETIEQNSYYKKVFKKNGILTPESLTYMLETNSHVAEFLGDVTQMSQEMHMILVEIATQYGLILTTAQAPRPSAYKSTPQNTGHLYAGKIIDIMEKIDPWLGYDTGTHSQHMHFFPGSNETSYKLYIQMIALVSQDMEKDPLHRFVDRGMSPERFVARNRVVETRSGPQFQEKMHIDGHELTLGVTELFNHPLIPASLREQVRKNHEMFVFDKFFEGKDPALHDFALKPKISHYPVSKKKPGKKGVYTIELRTADGPGADKDIIERNNILYGNKILQALEKFPL